MFQELSDIFRKPDVYEYANPKELWNDPYISTQMLKFHLDPDNDPASRNRKFMDASIQWIISKFRLDTNSRILDLGCGPGMYTYEFAQHGAQVTGIDISKNSIDYATVKAKEDNLSIRYINADYVTCDFNGKYNLVTMIYDDYCVLNPIDRKTLLAKILAVLDTNGSFIFDVLTDHYFESVQEKQSCTFSGSAGFWSPEAHFVFEHFFKYSDERVILEKDTVIEKSRRFTIYNYLKCFRIDEILQEASENGFHVTEYFSDISGTSYNNNSKEFALICRKQ